MTINVSQSPSQLFPEFHFDPADALRAKLLNREQAMFIRQRLQQVTMAALEINFTGTDEEVRTAMAKYTFLKGKMDAFQEILDDNKDALTEAQASGLAG